MGRTLRNSALLCAFAAPASAHVSEQGFVLLLPTDLYIAGGVLTVALTIALILFVPGTVMQRIFRTLSLAVPPATGVKVATRWMGTVGLLGLIACGWAGSADPLANPLPLWIWTIVWIGLVSVQGVCFDIWSFATPFAAPALWLRKMLPTGLRRTSSRRLGQWPAVLTLAAFAAFMLADPAPADPTRLATLTTVYFGVTVAGAAIFGRRWLVQAEFMTVMMRLFARVAAVRRDRGVLRIGFWGWGLVDQAAPRPGLAVFAVLLLGIGSFDGLYETFWWLGQTGVNPLEYPGRSAVMSTTLAGLSLSLLALLLVFAITLWAGLCMVGERDLRAAFCTFAPALLPIAVGYHIAHYLTSFLVDIQWTVAAMSDPLDKGWDLLRLGQFYVTTGFFNTRDTVQVIWLTQAGAVVTGHVVSILLAHAIALRVYGRARVALISQAPLAAFMVIYTLFGLWLLASPRGV